METVKVAPVQVRKQSERGGAQRLRVFSQMFSLVVNLWIGAQFFLFVRYLKSGGTSVAVPRPAGVEGWLPIGSLISLRSFLDTGVVNAVHPAGLVILLVIILTAFVFKKGFCSWICPIGFVSELLGDLSDRLFGRRLTPPRWLDYPLRSLKYVLMIFFVWFIGVKMTPRAVEAFLYSDYNVVADILMLRFFTDISAFALSVIAILFGLSLLIRGFWCRYLCPYGALLGLFGLLSPTRIVRNSETCIDCSACARVCPAFIRVDRVRQVVSDECSACMACVDSCPVKKTLQIHAIRKKNVVSSRTWAVALLVAFWVTLLGFKFFGPWENNVTREQYIRYMPGIETGEYQHPTP